jgi:signal transduction histidine kinase
VIALALIVGVFFVAQEVLTGLASGETISVTNDVIVVVRFWLLWAALTPAVMWALRRWPLDRKPIVRPILAQAAAGIVLACVQSLLTRGVRAFTLYVSGEVRTIGGALRQSAALTPFVWGVFTGLFFYAVVVMIYTALRFRTLYVAEQLSAAEATSRSAALEAELSRAKLDTLRSQLRPHFLFNTLNAISVFVTEDAARAQQMLLRLSTLLRRSLDEEAHEVPLRQELAFMNDYLDIQRGRFGDQLSVEVAIEPGVMDAHVPVFLLQPLIENAIEHGKREDEPTTIVLSAARDDDMLHLTVRDEGPGVARSGVRREGIGLRNTRARLHHLYGGGASVELHAADRDGAASGACVEIRIPLHMNGT